MDRLRTHPDQEASDVLHFSKAALMLKAKLDAKQSASSREGPSGSGSLVPSSEFDHWNDRNVTPWTVTENVQPSYYLAQGSESRTAALSMPGNAQQSANSSFLDHRRREIPLFTGSRQSFMDDGPNTSHSPGQGPTLHASTNSTASDSRSRSGHVRLSGNAKPFHISKADVESSQHQNYIPINPWGGEPLRLETGGGMALPHGPVLDISSKSQIGSAAPPPTVTQYPLPNTGSSVSTHGPRMPPSSAVHRSNASGHQSTFSFQANGTKYRDLNSEAPQLDPLPTFSSMRLEEGPSQNFYHQLMSPSMNAHQSGFASFPKPNETGNLRGSFSSNSQRTWGSGGTGQSHTAGALSQEGFGEGHYVDQSHSYRRSNQGSASPAGSEYRLTSQSPYYSSGGTPTTASDQLRPNSQGAAQGRAIPNTHSSLLDKKLRGLQQQQQDFSIPQINPLMVGNEPFRAQFPLQSYDYSPHNGFRLNLLNSYLPTVSGLYGGRVTPRSTARDHDPAHSLRSPLLEEFRSNSKTSKRYELRVRAPSTDSNNGTDLSGYL